jgi:amino acid permease
VDKFDTSVALLISAIVGAGVFALPLLANEVGILSVFVIFGAFIYMLGLGYLIVEMTPGTVEEEVETNLGPLARKLLTISELAVIFLALVAYAMGLRIHLGAPHVLILSILIIPLVMELHFPEVFTRSLALFILFFISMMSLIAIPQMEVPIEVFMTVTSTAPPSATVPAPLMGFQSIIPLFLAGAFAFFGHNMIPRVRNILRSKESTKKAFYMAIAIVFLLYLPFAVSVSGLGVDGLATQYLSAIFSEPLSSIIDLFAVIVFYTSFILVGLHLVGMFEEKQRGLTLTILGTFALYFVAFFISAPFHLVVASAGFAVTIYAFITALAALKAQKMQYLPHAMIVMTSVAWLLLFLQAL